MTSHEKFLCKYIEKFRAVDSDNNGIINEEEFRNLIKSMNINKSENEVQRFLNLIDPYSN